MSEEQESLTLTGQFLVAKQKDGTVSSPYLERLEPTRDIFKPVEWAKAKKRV